MENTTITRRHALRGAAAALACGSLRPLLAADPPRLFQIGACDWSLGRGGQPSALELASQIGLDGVQVSFGKPGDPFDLRRQANRAEYAKMAATHGVQIASLAMGILNEVPFASAPETQQWVADCIDVLPELGVRVVLLAFFGNGDIQGKPQLQAEVARRLKTLARAPKRRVLCWGSSRG